MMGHVGGHHYERIFADNALLENWISKVEAKMEKQD